MSETTRNQRRYAAKRVRRDAKRAARAALHGVSRPARPTPLEELETARRIRALQEEIQHLERLGAPPELAQLIGGCSADKATRDALASG